ncbi:BACON domain-containing protein [Bacteroides sp. 224]|uniref:BACON domain-containing protein n=1 Tax=Bacteroides sp. 224 TaxID=2302936 RepID=UPI0013D565CA|nr:BACON domain-containing protein [Bacteroides sp. 224]
MKKISALSAVIFLLLCMTACSSDDEKVPTIVANNQQALQQVAYADDIQGESTVSFTTLGAWHSVIKDASTTREGSSKSSNWVSISPNSGDKAGVYNINITLTPNESGENRSAIISIICGDQEIEISVSQKGVTKEEEKNGEEQKETEGIVKKINGETVVYMDFESVLIAKQIGEKLYPTKSYSSTEWGYIISKDYYNREWRCDYEYEHLGHLAQTSTYLTTQEGSNKCLALYYWDSNKLSYIRGDQNGVSRDGYLRTNLTYGSTKYTLGNIDINWLLATDEYYIDLPVSAIGIKTTKNENLLIEKTQIEEKGDGKYNYKYTYRYVFNEAGYITEIYETREHSVFENSKEEERLIYTFEY